MTDKKCEICGKLDGRGRNSLQCHLKSKHGLTMQEHFDRYLATEGDGICSCPDCLQKTNWSIRYQKYNDYCSKKCQWLHISNFPEQKKLRKENAQKMVKDQSNSFGKASDHPAHVDKVS